MAGHETLEGQCNYVLGGVDYELGAFVEARATLTEALRLYTRVGYVRGLAVAFQQLGRVTYREGELAEARRLMEESIGYFRNAAWPYGIAWDLITLGWIATDQGQPDHARACLTESLRLFGEIGAKSRMIECLEGFAQLEIALGRPERGLRLASACAALRLALGVALSPGERGALEPRIQRGQAALGRASGAAWAVGQRLSLDEAIAFALAAPPAKPPADPPEVFALTRREHQVAHLVAQGRTSRQIAEELIVAERTVETHLERIYAKLDVHSRVQLASWLTAHRPSVPQSSSTA
jgi:non-specific serine/threonine protein kinase